MFSIPTQTKHKQTKINSTVNQSANVFQIIEKDLLLADSNPPQDGNNGIIINEIMFYPQTGDYEWVELKKPRF